MTPFRSRRCLALVGAWMVLYPAHLFAPPTAPFSTNANRLTYLDATDPFYPHLNFPKLVTPQWVGEPGVEAVVILSIDDLRETPKYETFLRPILERLKRIDGRAPLSILVNAVAPTNAQLQAWLAEGLSLEVHTLAHPCPCLAQGSFTNAANTYHGCVDLLNHVPNNKPVAFRMPCCDSMNSPSPRFYAEIFNRANPAGQFLTIDSSVMNIFTTNDPALPQDLALDRDGREKFRKYLPAQTNAQIKVSMGSFATTIDDYPYPYVIGKLCWEFPAAVPSDWEAFNLHGSTNPVTLADWKSGLDATVLKQGVFTFIFHPHGWSSPAQFVEFIDYAVARYGKKIKFLNFREAQERLDKNLLLGNPLRATNGGDHGVRLLDLNNDGFLDVIVHNDKFRMTRLWDPLRNEWKRTDGFPFPLVLPDRDGSSHETGLKLGVIRADGLPSAFAIVSTSQLNEVISRAWSFDGQKWVEEGSLLSGLELDGKPVFTSFDYRDRGVRLRDVNNDGRCEWIVGNDKQNAVFSWSDPEKRWKKLTYSLPPGTAIVDAKGNDAGLRFVDVNNDGYVDALFSDEERFSLHLFVSVANPRLSWQVGWTDEVIAGTRTVPASSNPQTPRRDELSEIPRIVRAGQYRNNGAWFAHQTMWVQNEDTSRLPDKVDRRTFRDLLTADDPKPLSPQAALGSFRVRPGFKVELIASEPLVRDPIAFEWGADGKLWVVEMGDYPLGAPPYDGVSYRPGGRIKFLEDTNNDGVYDKATLFLDQVNFPTGVYPWRNGVIVSAAPEIFYAEDTDGDGKADKRVTLCAGFKEGNPQHRCNGFDYGLDNWLYGANGDSGGEIKSVTALLALGQFPSSPVSLRGRDFRFDPDTGAFEAIEGNTQYGRHRDDWGNWFGNNNPTWLWHYFLPDHYLARNPHLAVKTTKRMLANYPDSTRLFPASRIRQRFNDPAQAGHVTSGNSPTPYRDELFGPDFATSVFISDPVHNLVHREVLEADGVSFTSHRAPDETNSEFLASTDNWFRPTMLKTGPDGALYIADMYRAVIEHPEWITKSIQARLDLRAGADKGRLYRVYPIGATLRSIPRLDTLDPEQLVAALDSPNGWQRDTVQRLLVHRGANQPTGPLEKLLASAHAKTRVQALCALDGLNALTPQILVQSMGDAHFAVREQAVRLSEIFLSPVNGRTTVYIVQPGDSLIRIAKQNGVDASALRQLNQLKTDQLQVGQKIRVARYAKYGDWTKDSPSLENLCATLDKLAEDPDIRVRYQLAFTLGAWKDAAPCLVKLALHDRDNADMQTAVMSSATNNIGELLTRAIVMAGNEEHPVELIEWLLGLATALRKDDAIENALEHVAGQTSLTIGGAGQMGAFAAFLDALDRRNETFEQFKSGARPSLGKILDSLEKLFADARKMLGQPDEPEALIVKAIPLLGRLQARRAGDIDQLEGLIRPAQSATIQQAAVRGLARLPERAAASALLSGWRSYSPALRVEVLGALFSRAEWLRQFLEQIESGALAPAEVSAAYQQKLLTHPDKAIRERAEKVFHPTRQDRQAVLKEYESVARLRGDAGRGAALYQQHCAACHRLRGSGVELGPDLAGLAGKEISVLLTAIFDPNQAVEGRYLSYTAVSRGGIEVSGIIVAENPTSITLRSTGGKEVVLLRKDLKELTSNGLSLMPDGFEKILQPQAVADLLACINDSSRQP